jgi:hypothetical protein
VIRRCVILAAALECGDASGWSVAWHNTPPARLSLTAIKDTNDAFELKVEKRNNGPKGKPLTLRWADGALLLRSDIDSAQAASLSLRPAASLSLRPPLGWRS